MTTMLRVSKKSARNWGSAARESASLRTRHWPRPKRFSTGGAIPCKTCLEEITMAKPLRTGDIIRLRAPGYGEPDGECVVIANQKGDLVWFTAVEGGAAFVARRSAVRFISLKQDSNP